jgi:hypothetical protein
MIQRIQSIYLLIVILLSGVLPFFVDLWVEMGGEKVNVQNNILFLSLFLASAILALVCIFLFSNRKNQFVVNRLNMILNLFLLGFFVYRSLNLPGETEVSEKGIGMLIPIVSIVFLVMANRAIKRDEDLVKSVDRLR